MTSRDPPLESRREAILGLLAVPAVLAARPVGAAAGPAAGLNVELLVFRQPGIATGAAGIGTPSAPGPMLGPMLGPVLGPLLPGLRRAGFTLLAAGARTMPVAANATGALPFHELAAAAGVTGQLAVTRSQLLTVHVVAGDAGCAAGAAIDERRRVKFGDRHYFDSPCIGVILALTPLESAPPAAGA